MLSDVQLNAEERQLSKKNFGFPTLVDGFCPTFRLLLQRLPNRYTSPTFRNFSEIDWQLVIWCYNVTSVISCIYVNPEYKLIM